MLSSYMIVDSIFFEDKPQVCRTYWIIDLNQTHSRLTSHNAKILHDFIMLLLWFVLETAMKSLCYHMWTNILFVINHYDIVRIW